MRSERTERFLARVRAAARECGYAVAVHGSEARDLDLVALPWTPEALSADQLVARLCEEVPMVEYEQPKSMVANPEAKPWGRLAWSLAGCPDHQYVDLSVAPRAGEPVPLHALTSPDSRP
jgi:hypothetical protein